MVSKAFAQAETSAPSVQTEVWNFFFIGCLPYIEGIFLPLRTDNALRSIVGSSGQQPGGRSMSFNSSTARESIEAIDIRRIALRAFRDHLVLPIVDRVSRKSSSLCESRGSTNRSFHLLTTARYTVLGRA